MERLLNFSGDIAKVLLTNGAETYRVEETISYIVEHYTSSRGESIISPTAIICGVEGVKGGVIKRVDKRVINLTKVNMAINLSRRIRNENLTLEQAEEELKKIENSKNYSSISLNIISAIGCAAFAFLLGGGFLDAMIAFINAFFLYILLSNLIKLRMNIFFRTLVGGIFASLFSVLLSFILHINVEIVIISTIMLLVPGVALTSAFRDILEGHYIAGNSRLMEAIFIAFCLSLGVYLPISLIQFTSSYTMYSIPSLRILAAFASSTCFAYLFGAPKKELLFAGGAGLIGWIVLEASGAIFFAATAVSILSIICSKKRKAISSIYLIAGIIPYVPGAGIYRTMLNLVLGYPQNALSEGILAFGAAGSIALGIMVIYSIYNSTIKT